MHEVQKYLEVTDDVLETAGVFMKLHILFIFITYTLAAMNLEEKNEWNATEMTAFQYNPFQQGFMPELMHTIPKFQILYEEYKPEILQDLGPEITEFFNRYEMANGTHSVKRYTNALVARLAFKNHESRRIDVIKKSIPANLNELKYILGHNVDLEKYTHEAMHHELESYFGALRMHMQQIKDSEEGDKTLMNKGLPK